MSKFMVEITTDNSAYEDDLYNEIIQNLILVSAEVDSTVLNGVIRDSNGNKVGKFYTVKGE